MSAAQIQHFEAREIVYGGDSGVAVNIPGRYSLSNRYDSRGQRRVFVCRAINISPSVMVFAAPAKGNVGERVIALLHHIGRVEGVVSRNFDQGFAVKVALTEERRRVLGARISWLVAHDQKKAAERRKNDRFIPSNSQSKLILPDGTVEDCLILDLSVTGAAVSAFSMPPIGASLAVGNVFGRVVRKFSGGFGVHFFERQSRDHVEAMAILS